jgi:hypothetical protein
MDTFRLTELKAEINALASWLANYDNSVRDFLNGNSPTCVHFMEVIPTLNNITAASLAYDGAYLGHGSSFGALTDFIYEVSAIKRNAAIFNTDKLTYYILDDPQKATDADFNSGETTKFISYITGSSPDQGITI